MENGLQWAEQWKEGPQLRDSHVGVAETAMAWLGTTRGGGEEDWGYVFEGEAGSTCWWTEKARGRERGMRVRKEHEGTKDKACGLHKQMGGDDCYCENKHPDLKHYLLQSQTDLQGKQMLIFKRTSSPKK